MITYLYVAHVMTCSALRTCSALGMVWGGDDNILVRSTPDDMFGTTYMFGIGDGVGVGFIPKVNGHARSRFAARTN